HCERAQDIALCLICVICGFAVPVCTEPKEFDVRVWFDAGLACSNLDLPGHSINSVEMRKQKAAAPAFVFHNHAVNIGIQKLDRCWLRRREYVDRVFQLW